MIEASDMAGWPVALQLTVDRYIDDHRLPRENLVRADLALVLLRIADATPSLKGDALEALVHLTGRRITRCPAAVPPWPPKPVAKRKRPPTVSKVASPNPCSRNTDMFRRFSFVRVGMTVDQLLARGVTMRDLRVWKGSGRITITTGE